MQIQKIRNVAAPKDNEESQAAPRMLRLQMTDGHTSCTAIEYSSMSKIRWATWLFGLFSFPSQILEIQENFKVACRSVYECNLQCSLC